MTDTQTALERLTHRFAELKERHGFTDTTMLRLAALGLATVPDDDAVDRLDRTAAELKDAGSWAGPLSSSVRFVIAAMVLRRRLNATSLVEAVRETNAALKERKLRKSSTQGWLGALLLTLQSDGRPARPALLERFGEILAEWKADHRWLTGDDDYPMAAVHAAQDEPVASLTRRIEDAYVELDRLGFSKGDPLQLASHILGFLPEDGVGAAARFHFVAEALARPKRKLPSSQYDEAALLAVLGGDPEARVSEARDLAARLKNEDGQSFWQRLFSGFSDDLALSLAVGLMVAMAATREDGLRDAADSSAVALAVAAMEAQQAAAVAAVVATTAATSAATS